MKTDEGLAAAKRSVEEKKKRGKKPAKWGRKRKAQEVESAAEDTGSHVSSDPVLPPEIFDCVVVQSR